MVASATRQPWGAAVWRFFRWLATPFRWFWSKLMGSQQTSSDLSIVSTAPGLKGPEVFEALFVAELPAVQGPQECLAQLPQTLLDSINQKINQIALREDNLLAERLWAFVTGESQEALTPRTAADLIQLITDRWYWQSPASKGALERKGAYNNRVRQLRLAAEAQAKALLQKLAVIVAKVQPLISNSAANSFLEQFSADAAGARYTLQVNIKARAALMATNLLRSNLPVDWSEQISFIQKHNETAFALLKTRVAAYTEQFDGSSDSFWPLINAVATAPDQKTYAAKRISYLLAGETLTLSTDTKSLVSQDPISNTLLPLAVGKCDVAVKAAIQGEQLATDKSMTVVQQLGSPALKQWYYFARFNQCLKDLSRYPQFLIHINRFELVMGLDLFSQAEAEKVPVLCLQSITRWTPDAQALFKQFLKPSDPALQKLQRLWLVGIQDKANRDLWAFDAAHKLLWSTIIEATADPVPMLFGQANYEVVFGQVSTWLAQLTLLEVGVYDLLQALVKQAKAQSPATQKAKLLLAIREQAAIADSAITAEQIDWSKLHKAYAFLSQLTRSRDGKALANWSLQTIDQHLLAHWQQQLKRFDAATLCDTKAWPNISRFAAELRTLPEGNFKQKGTLVFKQHLRQLHKQLVEDYIISGAKQAWKSLRTFRMVFYANINKEQEQQQLFNTVFKRRADHWRANQKTINKSLTSDFYQARLKGLRAFLDGNSWQFGHFYKPDGQKLLRKALGKLDSLRADIAPFAVETTLRELAKRNYKVPKGNEQFFKQVVMALAHIAPVWLEQVSYVSWHSGHWGLSPSFLNNNIRQIAPAIDSYLTDLVTIERKVQPQIWLALQRRQAGVSDAASALTFSYLATIGNHRVQTVLSADDKTQDAGIQYARAFKAWAAKFEAAVVSLNNLPKLQQPLKRFYAAALRNGPATLAKLAADGEQMLFLAQLVKLRLLSAELLLMGNVSEQRRIVTDILCGPSGLWMGLIRHGGLNKATHASIKELAYTLADPDRLSPDFVKGLMQAEMDIKRAPSEVAKWIKSVFVSEPTSTEAKLPQPNYKMKGIGSEDFNVGKSNQ